MRSDMVLSVTWTKPLSPGDRRKWGTNSTGKITVEAGLSDLAPGHQPPYWSVTGSVTQLAFGQHSDRGGGCIHEEIIRYWPKLGPLIALHLSNEDGAPSHPLENGWYNLAGCYGGLGERYHGGNSKHSFPVTPPPDKPWMNTEYRFPTPDECVVSFARYVRVSVEEAADLVRRIAAPHTLESLRQRGDDPDARAAIRERWVVEVEGMRPRWLAESNAAKALLVGWGAKDRRTAAATS